MQFQFPLQKAVQSQPNGIIVISAQSRKNQYLDEVIDQMGEASAKAQQLKQVITTASRFYGSDQKIFLKIDGKCCQGLLKIGKKNLFHRDLSGNIRELQPLCVLDFYVHESVQRMGVGKELFEEMLKYEQITPEKLAYDRPSPKLIGFLNKHYHLNQYIPQNNNFVIFNQYFTNFVQSKGQKYHTNNNNNNNNNNNQQLDQLDIMVQQIQNRNTNTIQQQKVPQIKNVYQVNTPWATDYSNNINSQRKEFYTIK